MFLYSIYLSLSSLPLFRFCRMYKALLAGGDFEAAKAFLPRISRDDPDVRCIIKAMQKTYIKKPPIPVDTDQKKKKKTKK